MFLNPAQNKKTQKHENEKQKRKARKHVMETRKGAMDTIIKKHLLSVYGDGSLGLSSLLKFVLIIAVTYVVTLISILCFKPNFLTQPVPSSTESGSGSTLTSRWLMTTPTLLDDGEKLNLRQSSIYSSLSPLALVLLFAIML